MSLTVTDLADDFGKSKTDITWGITLVLMFRSVGSIIFGIASDRYGRKWPFVVNNLLFIVLELVGFPTRTSRSLLYMRSPLSLWAGWSIVVARCHPAWLGLAADPGSQSDEMRSTSIRVINWLTWLQGTGFCQTYQQFLACRALFGVAMGGLYGNAAATALEDCPEEARGLMSGILQQGVSARPPNRPMPAII